MVRSLEFVSLLLLVGAVAMPAGATAQEQASGAVLEVDQPGVIEVGAVALAAAFQTDSEDIATLIRTGRLDLRLGGESVAWHAMHDGAAIRFVAPEIRSPFSSRHRYLVAVGPGVTMEAPPLVRNEAVEPHRFAATKRFEQNLFPGPSGGPDPRQDLFFWHALSGDAQTVIPVSLPGLWGSSVEELRVYVHGATEHPEQPHRVELHWNGQSVGVFDLMGRQRHTIVVPLDAFPATFENELVIEQHVAGDAAPVVYVDAAEVDYDRSALADAAGFEFGGAANGAHCVTGLASETVHLYDVTDPATPKHYGEVVLDAPGRLRFTEPGAGLQFLAGTPAGVSTPVEVSGHFGSSLRSPSHDEEYIIIAASHLVADAEALADFRKADGYRVLLVDIEDVYWAFANGEPDPLAIRDFLRFAWAHWENAPRFVALVGKGHLDYRDILGFGGNALPPALAPTPDGLFPSDSMLGDVVGVDGAPEIPIGRFPITDGAQLAPILDVVEAFQGAHGSRDALFAADDSEHNEYAAAVQLLSDWVFPERVRTIDLNIETREVARDRLFSMWESLSWMTYAGHSGLDRMASEGLLTLADVPALAAMSSHPIVVGWTCNMVRFDIPGFSSLGEQLLVEGATAGVFSATGWSNHFETDLLRNGFTQAVFAAGAETLGEAMIRAHQGASDATVPQHRVYTLLGDPALRLHAASTPPEPVPTTTNVPAQDDGADAPEGLLAPGPSPAAADAAPGCEMRQIQPQTSPASPFGVIALTLGFALHLRRRRATRA
jgi:hypothetical protein